MPETAVQGTEETQATTETKEEVKQPTFAEVEAAEKALFDKQHNRDIAKMFPGQVKDTPKAEEKKQEPKPEAKADTPPPQKEETGYEKDLRKLRIKNRELRQANEQLNERLTRLEKGEKPTIETKTETAAAIEPKREDFRTVDEYIVAIRKFDKEQAAAKEKSDNERAVQAQTDQAWQEKIASFNSRINDFKKDHPDWDEKAANTKVAFEPALVGVMVGSGVGPELLYYFADHQTEAKSLNKLTEQSVVAAGGADDVGSVLKYLSANPAEVARLNGLSPSKAVAYIGRIEAKIEAESTPNKKVVEMPKKDTSSGATATTPNGSGGDATKVDKGKSEPPPKLAGSAPSNSDWTDTANMSFKERERLYYDDPRNRRR